MDVLDINSEGATHLSQNEHSKRGELPFGGHFTKIVRVIYKRVFGQQVIDDCIRQYLKICLDSGNLYIVFFFLRRTLGCIRILGQGWDLGQDPGPGPRRAKKSAT